jgi:hypothetical protein
MKSTGKLFVLDKIGMIREIYYAIELIRSIKHSLYNFYKNEK